MKCSGSSSCPDTSLRPSTAKGLRRWPITIWLNGWRFSIPSLRFHNPLSPTTFYHRPGYGATKSAPAGIGSTNEGRSRPDAPGQHRRDYTTFLRLVAGAREEFLEVKIKFPSGGVLGFMRDPMAEGWFNAICVLVGIFIVGSGLLQFFGMMVGA